MSFNLEEIWFEFQLYPLKFTQSGVHGFLLELNEKKMKSEDSKHSINSGYYF